MRQTNVKSGEVAPKQLENHVRFVYALGRDQENGCRAGMEMGRTHLSLWLES